MFTYLNIYLSPTLTRVFEDLSLTEKSLKNCAPDDLVTYSALSVKRSRLISAIGEIVSRGDLKKYNHQVDKFLTVSTDDLVQRIN